MWHFEMDIVEQPMLGVGLWTFNWNIRGVKSRWLRSIKEVGYDFVVLARLSI